jgi:hypothetical protein
MKNFNYHQYLVRLAGKIEIKLTSKKLSAAIF